MYSRAAEEEDDRMVEQLQKDAEGIIIFVRYFHPNNCTVIAALVVVSIQGILGQISESSIIRVVQVQHMWDPMCYGVQDSSPEREQYQSSPMTNTGSVVVEKLLLHLN